jgi:membrane protease YdiL (CAAX protease family)
MSSADALASPAVAGAPRIAPPIGAGPNFVLADPLLTAALAGAYGAFGAVFRGPRERFWQRMTRTGLALGGLALAADPSLRRLRVRKRDVALGLASAAGLYAIFQVGDRMARRIMPKGAEEIGETYALRVLRPTPELAARLGFIIGPAEELFWRGFVQRRMRARLGRWRGAAVASVMYGGAHLVSENLTLTGAATVAGAYWGGLAALGMPMGALVVSHVAWDIWIFLLAPTEKPASVELPSANSSTVLFSAPEPAVPT